MAADVDVNITMSASGGSASAAEIGKAESALNGVSASSGRMEGMFQHKFQHIGLMLFAGDALRASGLGAETRQVITALNLALTAGAGAAGLSSGGLMLVVTALGALAGIAIKVIGHEKSLADATEKAVEADDKYIESLNEKIRLMEGYQNTVGKLNSVQQNYLDTMKSINEEEGKKANADLVQRMNDLNKSIALEQDYGEKIDWVQSLWEGNAEAEWKTNKQNTKAMEENNAALLKNKAALADVMLQLNSLHTHGVTAFKDVAQAAKDAAKANEEAAKEADKVWAEEANARLDEIHEETEEMVKSNEKMAATAEKFAGQIGGDFGNAFAKSLVEGKNFTEQMRQAFKNMAEQIISDIVRMITEWAIFSAMSGMGGNVGMMGMAGLSHMGIGNAVGGSSIVDRPTLFMAGEGGPEMATFTPLASMGSTATGSGGQGGTKISIGSVNVTANGVEDPDTLAKDVGRKIIQQIRGMGQLDFVRA